MLKSDICLAACLLLVGGTAIGVALNQADPATSNEAQAATISPNYNLIVDTAQGQTYVVDYNMTEQDCRSSMGTLAAIMAGNNNHVSCEAWQDGRWKEILLPQVTQ